MHQNALFVCENHKNWGGGCPQTTEVWFTNFQPHLTLNSPATTAEKRPTGENSQNSLWTTPASTVLHNFLLRSSISCPQSPSPGLIRQNLPTTIWCSANHTWRGKVTLTEDLSVTVKIKYFYCFSSWSSCFQAAVMQTNRSFLIYLSDRLE